MGLSLVQVPGPARVSGRRGGEPVDRGHADSPFASLAAFTLASALWCRP